MKDNMLNTDSFELTKSWLESELSQRTKVSTDVTRIIFIGLINRTNTGALATALGKSPSDPPITRHIQPFKAIARQIMESKGIHASTPLTFFKDNIELTPGPHLIKETIGPNIANPAEWIDSLKILLSKGIDPTKITFVPTFRDPLDTISSWKFMWGWDLKDIPFESFNKSFRYVSEKINLSRKIGINVVPYVHEFLRDYNSAKIINRTCDLIGIPYNESMVRWDDPGSSEDGLTDWYFDGNIVKYDQPPDRWIRGVLSIEHGGRGGLIWKPIGTKLQFTEDEQKFVTDRIQPAIDIHNTYVLQAKEILNL